MTTLLAGGATVPDAEVLAEQIVVEMDRGRADRDAEFALFMVEATPALWQTAWLLCGDKVRAEELVQDALTRTFLAWPRARAGDPLAYTRRVLANLRIDSWRRHRREVLTRPEELPETPVSAHSGQHADRDQLVRALATLSIRQRRIVVLRHLVGLSEREVAADLGISVGTVKSTASRGLAHLRGVLGEIALDDSKTPFDDAARRKS